MPTYEMTTDTKTLRSDGLHGNCHLWTIEWVICANQLWLVDLQAILGCTKNLGSKYTSQKTQVSHVGSTPL